MLQYSGRSDEFWVKVMLTTVHIIDMSPSMPIGYKILQELCIAKKHDYRNLWIFGCEVYTLVPNDECLFVSFSCHVSPFV